VDFERIVVHANWLGSEAPGGSKMLPDSSTALAWGLHCLSIDDTGEGAKESLAGRRSPFDGYS
jgi:hypothetical protein